MILHDEPGRNDTVRLGMEAMDGCDTVTFVQGDQPLIRPASIAALLRAAERDAAAEHHAAAERDAAAEHDAAAAAGRDAGSAAGRDAIGVAGRDAEGRDAAENCAMEHDAAESGVDVAVGCDAAGRDAACVAEHDAVWRDAAGCGVTDVSGRPSARIWRTCFDGAPGAPVLFPSWAFDELRSLPHGKGGGFVAKMHAEYVRTIEVSSEWELFDVDTRDDLQQLQAYVARCGM